MHRTLIHLHAGTICTAILAIMITFPRQARAQATDLTPDPRPVEAFHDDTPAPGVELEAFDPTIYPLGMTDGTWMAQGPAPTVNAQVQNLNPNNEVDGAIHAVVAHPTNNSVMYVGTVNGGIWRSMNANAASPTWTPLTDFEQSLSIGALEMDPGNTMVLLAGIGRFSSFGGDPPFQLAGGDLSGLLRTTDGGSTWNTITDPLLVGEHISAVASRANILLAGANDFFGGGGTGGLFRSIDTGGSWVQISGGAGTGLPVGTVDDLGGDPAATTRLYAALQGDGIYRTDNTGATWTEVSTAAIDVPLNTAMQTSTNTRIAVAFDSRVFVLVTRGSTGVTSYVGYSDDQGASWTQMDVPGTAETALQGRDELMGLVADPGDSDIVYVSAISQRSGFPNSVGATSFHAHMFRGDVTRARGLTGNVSNQWDHLTHATGNALMPNGGTAGTSAPHADSRELTFAANGDLIEVNDGGVNRRNSPGDNTGDWRSINGDIQVTELHSVAYDTNFDLMIGGTQDTGAVEQSATGSTIWNTLDVADGGKVAIDDSVAGISVRYYSRQNLAGFTRRTCNPGCVNVQPAMTGVGGAQFYTPVEVNAFNSTRLLLGTIGGLSESMDQANTFNTVPGSAVTANSDARMVYGHPNNAELIYIGAGGGVFVRTTAGGNLAPTAAAFPGGMVFGITVDPANQNIAYAIGNGTVFQTPDGGATWTNITGDIADDGAGSFRAIAYMPNGTTDRVAVGTNAGVYISIEGSLGNWFLLGGGLPNAPVWDLDYDAVDDVLVSATLGRGAWVVQNASTVNAPPVAICQDVTADADAMCLGHVTPGEVDDGSFDPDGDPITLSLSPPGPYMLGDTAVTLTVEDDGNLTATCEATITVVDVTPPDITCAVDVTITCGESTDPSNTGSATAVDNCDATPTIGFNDVVIPTTCPADPIQEVIDRTWTATDFSMNSSSCLQKITVLKQVKPLDIKPGSCPNAHRPNSKGVLPVSLAGTDEFDVATVDVSTLLISRADCVGGAIPPVRMRFEDAATPFEGVLCDCHSVGGDGILDLSLKFDRVDLRGALLLDAFAPGDSVELVVSGTLLDGCDFIASDCISIR